MSKDEQWRLDSNALRLELSQKMEIIVIRGPGLHPILSNIPFLATFVPLRLPLLPSERSSDMTAERLSLLEALLLYFYFSVASQDLRSHVDQELSILFSITDIPVELLLIYVLLHL